MIHGMTGYGRGEAAAGGLRAVADVRTVNHRALDVELHAPSLSAALEDRLRKLVARRLARGKVDVRLLVDLPEGAPSALRVNAALVRDWVATLRSLGRQLDLAGEPSLDHVAALPWARAFEVADATLAPEQEAAVEAAVSSALEEVAAMRRREGAELVADLEARVRTLALHLDAVREASAGLAAAHAGRIRERVRELAKDVAVDEARIAQEAALLADRADVAEELARLSAHLAHVRDLLAGDGPAGKKLEFTLQEALRETNTLGSKARGFDVSARVIEMKSELERMREQVANVE